VTLRLSDEFRRSLDQAAEAFHLGITTETEEYLISRGFTCEVISEYCLGTVTGGFPGYSDYAGMLSIPYWTPRGGFCAMKLRRAHDCDDSCEHARFLMPAGHETRLYNTRAFDKADQLGFVGIAEGESDTWTLDHLVGIPTVGIPGVKTWDQHPEWALLFRGYRRVLVFRDDDDPGHELAKRIAREIDTAEIVALAAKDATKTFQEYGREEIRMAAGV